MNPIRVLIAGIGGASLGTEIQKSLSLAGNYEIFGCDISKNAYGLYEPLFSNTWLVDENQYVDSVLELSVNSQIQFVIPGGEKPMEILSRQASLFKEKNIHVIGNSPEVILSNSDKIKSFNELANKGVKVPRTKQINEPTDIEFVGFPCIIKPSTGTGGSASVFFATNLDEAIVYSDFIRRSGSQPLAQEYIDDSEGEFTIGVLSSPSKEVIGSVAMRRVFDAKLSVSYRGRGGLISSGYSQGYIGEFTEICLQAERIALLIESVGPINIQGRLKNGVLLPFEVNPRFSASTYLRAMAGFNEVDVLIKYILGREVPPRAKLRHGLYLRSLSEIFVKDGMQK